MFTAESIVSEWLEPETPQERAEERLVFDYTGKMTEVLSMRSGVYLYQDNEKNEQPPLSVTGALHFFSTEKRGAGSDTVPTDALDIENARMAVLD